MRKDLHTTKQAQLKEAKEGYGRLDQKFHSDKYPYHPRAVAASQKVSTNPTPQQLIRSLTSISAIK